LRSHRPSPARLALIAAGLLVAIPVAWACAPWLSNWLIGADSLVLTGPLGDFGDEVTRLWPEEDPPGAIKAVESEDIGESVSYFGQTVLADRADLEEALAHTPGLLDIQKEAILHNHDRYLADFTGVDRTDLERLLHGVQSKQPGHETIVPGKGMPAEFYGYAEGAIAYHELRLDAAVDAWERLLRRPDAERHYRSTWAAFMLGKIALRTDPATAVTWFRRTRMLAGQGFADRLGLAASSLGWEAWAENALGHEDRALVLYGEQMRTGDSSAFVSLQLTCGRILGAGPEALGRVARNPEARPIFTAWMVSHNTEAGTAWQKALRDAGVQDADGADRLAWAAYQAGDFDGAAAWLDQASEAAGKSAMAKWVRARLLLRDGKLDDARKLLDEAATELPPLGIDMETAFNIVWETGEIMPAPQRASGEEAAVQLAQGDFTGAMDRFLRAGYWLDAAYLAERVLGADELKAYVDTNWPADLAAGFKPATGDDWDTLVVGGYTEPALERLAYEIRHLLGRRLAREGHPDDARPYLSGEILTRMEKLSSHLTAGHDRSRPSAARAEDLFQAACLLRHHGLELTATEAEPDFAVVDGEYDLAGEFYGLDRKDRLANQVLHPASEERARLERYRLRPSKRFHYRYRAADLAWEAAKLVPAGEEKAGMLATAGNWIASRDPQEADRFYKELVRCCGATELGRQADESRWFPEADACPKED
jgi:tetratricopeptide (TPR) repeat protein